MATTVAEHMRPTIVVGSRLDDRRPCPADLIQFRDALTAGGAQAYTDRGRIRIEHAGEVLVIEHDLARDADVSAEDIHQAAIGAINLLAERSDWEAKADDPPIDDRERHRFALMAAMCRAHGIHGLPMLTLMEASPFEGYSLFAGDHRWHGQLDVHFTPAATEALDAIAPRTCQVRWIRNQLSVEWSRGYPIMLGENANPWQVLDDAGLIGVDCLVGTIQGRRDGGSMQVMDVETVPPAATGGPIVHHGDVPGEIRRISDRQMAIGAFSADGHRVTDAKVVRRGIMLVSRTASARELDAMETFVDLLDEGIAAGIEEVRSDTRDRKCYEVSFRHYVPREADDHIRKAFATAGITHDRIEIRETTKLVRALERDM